MVDKMLGITDLGLFVYGDYMKGPITFVIMQYDYFMNWYSPIKWHNNNFPTFKILIRDINDY